MATTTYSHRSGPLNVTDTVRSFGRRLSRLATHFLASLDVARQRRELLRLDERALNDIGIRGADARNEAMRGFCDIPEHMKTRN